ncbi:MAG: RNA polymerase sigma factor [Candidatus Rifleibacteriota bacterium]
MSNEKDFSQLIEETYRSLCFFLRYLGLPEAEADDMAQEVYIKAYKAFERFDENRSFKSWIFSIAKNTFIDWTRKQKTQKKFLEQNFVREFSETFEDDSNNRSDIRDLISKLSAEEQILIELRFFQDLQFKEIAELTGLTVGAVKMRLLRVLDRMKDSVKREQYGEHL